MAAVQQPATCSKECARAYGQIVVTADLVKLVGQIVAQGAPKAAVAGADGKPINLADLTRKA